MQLLVDYIIPCVLCEDPLEHVTITRRDDGREVTERVRLPHRCHQMQEVLAEGRR